jgi:hypothetical protein
MNSELLEILKYTLPAIIVLLATYIVLRSLLKGEEQRRKHEYVLQNRKIITPMRLQAYERVTLFLERISFDSMLKRFVHREQTVSQLQQKLLASIRQEFEHNFSQQIYLSHESWQIVITAKENIVKIINTTALELSPKEPAIMLSKTLLEKTLDMGKTPSAQAIEFIKHEASELF